MVTCTSGYNSSTASAMICAQSCRTSSSAASVFFAVIRDNLLSSLIGLLKSHSVPLTTAAIAAFESAVALQDTLPYMEPPFWYYPTRQSLGEAFMAAGRFADAEAIYRRDLELFPRNGWSTFGLIAALSAQGRTEEVADLQTRFERIWSNADVTLTGSRL